MAFILMEVLVDLGEKNMGKKGQQGPLKGENKSEGLKKSKLALNSAKKELKSNEDGELEMSSDAVSEVCYSYHE